jgi:hypothetical protein
MRSHKANQRFVHDLLKTVIKFVENKAEIFMKEFSQDLRVEHTKLSLADIRNNSISLSFQERKDVGDARVLIVIV